MISDVFWRSVIIIIVIIANTIDDQEPGSCRRLAVKYAMSACCAVCCFEPGLTIPRLFILFKSLKARCQILKQHQNRRKRQDDNTNLVESHNLTPFTTDNLWSNGAVYYRFDETYATTEIKNSVITAMRLIEQSTCVRFVEVPETYTSTHLYITNGKYCSSFVGKQPNLLRQDVTLPAQCFKARGAVHELIHALGFGHEQTRGDRDNYVQVNWYNIPNPYWFTFEQDKDAHYLLRYAVPYDYLSIMHYGPFDFAIDKRQPTLVSTNGYFNVPINQELSQLDMIKINLLYNCQDRLRDHVNKCIDLMKDCYTVPVQHCTVWPYLTNVCRQRCNMCH